MTASSNTTKSMQECTRKLKQLQLKNLVKVQSMHYKKVHIGKASDILRFIIILKQSVPVIENLINNADTVPSFKMAMQLIGNAN